jgi:hypothetical protein
MAVHNTLFESSRILTVFPHVPHDLGSVSLFAAGFNFTPVLHVSYGLLRPAAIPAKTMPEDSLPDAL